MLIGKSDLDPRTASDGSGNRVLSREVFFKGRVIIEQGDVGHRAYYIERGRVEVLVREGAHMLKVAELGPGDIFGEMALINQEPRSATVRALDDVSVTIISRDEIEGKMKRIQDNAMRALINVLTQRLRRATAGQMDQYRKLEDFQLRIAAIVGRIDEEIDSKNQSTFRKEIMPLLEDLQQALKRLQR